VALNVNFPDTPAANASWAFTRQQQRVLRARCAADGGNNVRARAVMRAEHRHRHAQRFSQRAQRQAGHACAENDTAGGIKQCIGCRRSSGFFCGGLLDQSETRGILARSRLTITPIVVQISPRRK